MPKQKQRMRVRELSRLSRASSLLPLVLVLMLAIPAQAAEPGPPVEIEGLEGEALDNVRAYLQIDKDGHGPKLNAREQIHWQAEAEGRIREALQALGYYEATITTSPGKNGQPSFHIARGHSVKVGRLDIRLSGEAEHDPEFKKLLEKQPLKPQARFHQGQYEDLKGELEDLAQERGYFDAKFTTREVRVSRTERRADIQLVYATGRRYRFGALSFNQSPIAEGKLRQLATFEPGEAFERGKLEKLQRRLERANYFDLVLLSAEPGQAVDGRIPVAVTLTPRPRWLYEFGAGFGTDTGPRLLLGAQNRIANEDGHRYGVRLSPSQRRSEYTGYYEIPLDPLTGDVLRFEAGYKETDDDLGISEVLSAKAERSWRLGDSWYGSNMRFAYFLQIQNEDYQLIGEPERSSFLVIPGARLSARKANDPLYPTEGYRWQLLVQGAEESLGSDIRFAQSRLDAKWLHGFIDKQRLILRANIGYTAIREADFEELPTSLRYAAGGDQSVRGYDYNSLGPKNEEDENLGGRYLLVGSAEYDYQLRDKWLVAGFVDTGNAFDELDGYELKTGVGLGLRWLSPVGPIRIDLAHPLDDESKSFRLHFSMGPEL